jgi:hypothetical protein
LPGKVVSLLTHPFRRIRLEQKDSLRQREFWWQVQQDVCVVLCAANRQGNHFVVFANRGQVSPQSRLPFFRDGIAAVLGAEDQMDVVPRKGMCHSVAPSGLYIIALHVPTASAVGYDVPSLMGLVATPNLGRDRELNPGAPGPWRKQPGHFMRLSMSSSLGGCGRDVNKEKW